MADYTVKRVDDMERTFAGAFVLARASLGVASFGLQVLDLPPDWEGPAHAHRGMSGDNRWLSSTTRQFAAPIPRS